MDKQQHRIFRLKVDCSLSSKETPAPIQDRISRLVKTRLTKKIDELLSEFGDPSIQLKIDRLNLDVGKISIDDLEEDFPLRLEEALRASLLKLQQTNQLKPAPLQRTQSPSIEILGFLLEKGNLPWWAARPFTESPTSLFRRLMQADAAEVKHLLLKVMNSEWTRKRLVIYFDDTDLKQVVKLLEPVNGETIISYNEVLANQHEKAPILKIKREEFRKMRWELILKYLYEERGSEFNQKSFLKQILIGLAARFNMTYRDLILMLMEMTAPFAATDQKGAAFLKNILLLGKAEKAATQKQSILSTTKDAAVLLKGFSEEQRTIATTYLPFIEGVKEYWPTGAPNLDIELMLIDRLWKFNKSKAILLIRKLTLLGANTRYLLERLPDHMIRSTIAASQPSLHNEYWNLRADLISLAHHRLIVSWTPSSLGNMISRYYLEVLTLPFGKWYNVQTLLKFLLGKMTALTSKTYQQLLKDLSLVVPTAMKKMYFQSDLMAYLRILLEEERLNKETIAPTESLITVSTDWSFDPKKESVSVYLARLKSWLNLKEKERFLFSIYKQPQHVEKWLPSLLSQWPMSEVERLFLSLWPNLYSFVSSWIRDSCFLISKGSQQYAYQVPSEQALATAIWIILMKSGVGGLSRTRLVSNSLSRMAAMLRITEGKFFHTFHRLAIDFSTALQLKEVLPQLIERAIQSKLFLPLSPKPSEKNTQGSPLIIQLETLTIYFESGKLPLGQNISSLRSIFDQLRDEAPSQLRLWLQKAIREKSSRDRLILFFATPMTVELMNLVETQAGNYALALLKVIHAKGSDSIVEYQGREEKEYWRLVWQTLQQTTWKGFRPRQFIIDITQKVAQQKGINYASFLEQLGKLIAKEDQLPLHLVQSALRVAYFVKDRPVVGISKRQSKEHGVKFEFSTMTIAQLTAYGKQFLQLSIKEKAKQWDLLSDQQVVDFFAQLLQPDDLNRLLDITELIGEVDRKVEKKSPRFFPVELSTLLLNAIFNDRGSFTNQKTFIAKLLKDWARAHNMSYQKLIESLWPIVWELGPVFRHHGSLNVFSEVLKEELEPERLTAILATNSYAGKTIKPEAKEEKAYRKLWDRDEVVLKMDEVWLIHNAGLAILWPYLNVLFERAGFMKNSQFVNEKAQQKAILLSEYLVSKEKSPAEHKLVFNKVLCNYPVAAPIDVRMRMTKRLRELCEGLLEAVISHWDIIGEVSVDALRESFLIREGNLGITAKHWQLQVDSKAYDVLLRKLPWGLSPINLSWMEKVIKVEWS